MQNKVVLHKVFNERVWDRQIEIEDIHLKWHIQSRLPSKNVLTKKYWWWKQMIKMLLHWYFEVNCFKLLLLMDATNLTKNSINFQNRLYWIICRLYTRYTRSTVFYTILQECLVSKSPRLCKTALLYLLLAEGWCCPCHVLIVPTFVVKMVKS